MIVLVCCCFLGLTVLCLLLRLVAGRTRTDTSAGDHPHFRKLQHTYLAAYLMASYADWLQGPYLYKLYFWDHGLMEEEIIILYLVGSASAALMALLAPLAANHPGRKKLCLSFTVLFSVSCLMSSYRNIDLLIAGRIFGGAAIAILYSTFEAWYIHEHTETYDFPKEWISSTFSKAATWNAVLAIVAGLNAAVVTAGFKMGLASPFQLAVLFLVLAAGIIVNDWTENYSETDVELNSSGCNGMNATVSNKRIHVCLIAVISILMESVIYVVMVVWTPVLDMAMINYPQSSLGIVFACFMLCILLGQTVFRICLNRHKPVALVLLAATGIALVASIFLLILVVVQRNHGFLPLLIFQFAVGLYGPAVGHLRQLLIPDPDWRSLSRNLLRMPVIIIAYHVLSVYGFDEITGPRYVFNFVVCTVLLCVALLFSAIFLILARDHSALGQQNAVLACEPVRNTY